MMMQTELNSIEKHKLKQTAADLISRPRHDHYWQITVKLSLPEDLNALGCW